MRLLIYSHFFAPSIGGVENIVLSLASGLQGIRDAQGVSEFDVTVVTQTPAGHLDDSAYPFRVLRQPGLLRLWQAVRECDVIHMAGPALLPLAVAFLARRPTVIEHHGYQAICPNGILLHQPGRSICPGHFQAKRYLECWRCQRMEVSLPRTCVSLVSMGPRYWLTQKAAANLAITRHVMERHGLSRFSAVYYGIDDLQEGAASSPAVTSKLCFAYVGRFTPEKGIAVLVRASAILHQQGHEFEVRLIGDGPLRGELETLIQQNGLGSCVRITGYLAGTHLKESLRDVRVVVMPSIWEETAGLAAIEQMMRGRLVIASNVGGLAEVVGDVGLTFSLGDARALADSMKTVLLNPDMVKLMGRKARDRALRLFSRQRMIDEHARLYKQMSAASKS